MRQVIVTVLAIFCLLGGCAAVYAHSLGGKWPAATVYLCDTTPFRPYTLNAAWRWNTARNTRSGQWPLLQVVDLDADGRCLGEWQVNAQVIHEPNVPTYAWGIPGPAYNQAPYTVGDLVWNQPRMGELSDSDRGFVALHELGHLLGLAHNKLIIPNRSVMSTLWWYNGIYGHDTGDLNAIYP